MMDRQRVSKGLSVGKYSRRAGLFITTAAVCALTVSIASADTTEYYVGASMNFASYLQDKGIVYKENGVATDPYASIANHGGNIVRLEHVFGPYENSYTNGYGAVDWGEWNRVKSDVATANSHNLDVFLTLTFKPQASHINAGSSNYIPDEWVGLSDYQLRQNIYNSTYSMLDELGQAGMLPAFVSIGNEVNGMFMENPYGYSYDAQRMTDMMNAGFDAVKDIAAAYNTDIHAAAHIFGPDNIDWWLDTANWSGLNDFDTVALSYYPDWHSFNDFGGDWAALVQWAKNTYGKNVFVLETAQSWTNGFSDSKNNVYTYNPYPGQSLSPATQRQFLADMAQKLIDAGGLGVITWGTEWVGSEGVLAYADQWGDGSSWENNTYWDFDNNLHDGINWMADIQDLYGPDEIEGDLDGDGFVGLDDLDIVLGSWNQSVTAGSAADPTGDGFVGLDDLDVVLGNWNAGTPASAVIPEPMGPVVFGLFAPMLLKRR